MTKYRLIENASFIELQHIELSMITHLAYLNLMMPFGLMYFELYTSFLPYCSQSYFVLQPSSKFVHLLRNVFSTICPSQKQIIAPYPFHIG